MRTVRKEEKKRHTIILPAVFSPETAKSLERRFLQIEETIFFSSFFSFFSFSFEQLDFEIVGSLIMLGG